MMSAGTCLQINTPKRAPCFRNQWNWEVLFIDFMCERWGTCCHQSWGTVGAPLYRTQHTLERWGTCCHQSGVLLVHLYTEHNIPLCAVDHAGQLIWKMFPDSKITEICLWMDPHLPNCKSASRPEQTTWQITWRGGCLLLALMVAMKWGTNFTLLLCTCRGKMEFRLSYCVIESAVIQHQERTSLQVCHKSASLPQVCKSATSLQVCHKSASLLQVCHKSASLPLVCKSATVKSLRWTVQQHLARATGFLSCHRHCPLG